MRAALIVLVFNSLAALLILFPAASPAQANVTACPPLQAASQTISATAILDCLRAGQPIILEGVQVEGDLDLTQLGQENAATIIPITVPLKLIGVHFTGAFIATDPDHSRTLSFMEPLDLRSAVFDTDVTLTGAQFNQAANFSGASFQTSADFTQATFSAGVSFDQAEFNGPALFFNTSFAGGADFIETRFKRAANFLRAHFDAQAAALFLKAQFGGPTLFDEARFPAAAIFQQAHFTGTVHLDNIVAEGKLSFREAVFQRAGKQDVVSFKGAALTQIDLNDAQLDNQLLDLSNADYQSLLALNFDPAKLAAPTDLDVNLAVLRRLEVNFRNQSQLNTANEIVYWRSRAERSTRDGLAQALETVFLDWPFGYGVRPLHAIAVSLVMILAFAIFYYPIDTIRSAPLAPPKPRERKLALRLSEIPVARDGEFPDLVKSVAPARRRYPRLDRVWQAITFSFSVFTKIGWGEQVAVRKFTIVVIEWVLGLIMIAGLFFSLTNTIPLLYALLKSIF